MPIEETLRRQANAAFRFVIEIDGENIAAFTECTLPAIEWETEDVKEGGLNTYTHQLPGRRKAGKISFKNGLSKGELFDWYIDTMGETFTRKPVTVSLLDSKLESIIAWHIEDAYPVKWAGPQLRSGDNTIAIQALELACGEITVS